jgi:hypothetical protein
MSNTSSPTYDAPHLVALCYVPQAFNARDPLSALKKAYDATTHFGAATNHAVIRDAIFAALYSRMRAGRGSSSKVSDGDILEGVFQAGRAGLLAAVRLLSPAITGTKVSDLGAVLDKMRTVIDGTPAVSASGQLLPFFDFSFNVGLKASSASTGIPKQLELLVPAGAGDSAVWMENMLFVIFGIAMGLYMYCSYLERLFKAQSISFSVQAFTKVLQRYLVSDALDRFAIVFMQGSVERNWLQQTSKRIQDSAMTTPTIKDLSAQMQAILQTSRTAKDVSSQLQALNDQYMKRVERTRVFESRSQTESQHVRGLRREYYAWVLAYIAVIVSCVILVIFKQDATIFVLVGVILGIFAASYIVRAIQDRM